MCRHSSVSLVTSVLSSPHAYKGRMPCVSVMWLYIVATEQISYNIRVRQDRRFILCDPTKLTTNDNHTMLVLCSNSTVPVQIFLGGKQTIEQQIQSNCDLCQGFLVAHRARKQKYVFDERPDNKFNPFFSISL